MEFRAEGLHLGGKLLHSRLLCQGISLHAFLRVGANRSVQMQIPRPTSIVETTSPKTLPHTHTHTSSWGAEYASAA